MPSASLVARVKVMLGGRHGRELRVARVGGARRRVHDARVLRLLLAEVLLLHHGDVSRAVHLQQRLNFYDLSTSVIESKYLEKPTGIPDVCRYRNFTQLSQLQLFQNTKKVIHIHRLCKIQKN